MNLKNLYKKYSFKNIKGGTEGLVTITQNQIEDLHLVLLKIVDDVMKICEEKEYICFLGGGSALGAIRHKGFIPWDDDIDLNITRSSYDKFIPEFKKKYGDKYWIHTPEDNPKYGKPVCQIRMRGTRVKTKEDLFDDSEAGAYVDLFIIENTYNNRIMRNLHGVLCLIAKIFLSCRRFYRDRKSMMKIVENDNELTNISYSRLVIGFLCSFMSVEKWTVFTNSIFAMCKDNNSDYVSIPTGRWHFFGELYNRETFCSLSSLPFEGRNYSICTGIKDYMVQLYGNDYMQVPPIEKREKHVYWEFNLGESTSSDMLKVGENIK